MQIDFLAKEFIVSSSIENAVRFLPVETEAQKRFFMVPRKIRGALRGLGKWVYRSTRRKNHRSLLPRSPKHVPRECTVTLSGSKAPRHPLLPHHCSPSFRKCCEGYRRGCVAE